MFNIEELKIIDKQKGYCGKNVIFKTIRMDKENKKIAIVSIEEQEKRQNYCASLYILLPNETLINACRCFVDNDDILHENKKLADCIKNFRYRKNEIFNTCYDLCDFVNIENNVYLCFHRWLGDKEKQKPDFTEYFNIIANTYNDVVYAILEIFKSYCLKQLDKKKIEYFDRILKEMPIDVGFIGCVVRKEYIDYFKKLNEITRYLVDVFNIKTNELQAQKIII